MDVDFRFPCDFCDKKFTTKRFKKIHVEHFHEGKRWKCSICHDKFIYKYYFNAHNKKMHGKRATFKEVRVKLAKKQTIRESIERRHKCGHCDTKFSYLSVLRQHIKSKHEGERFQCSLCQKLFSPKSNFQKHNRDFHNFAATFKQIFVELKQKQIICASNGKISCQFCTKTYESKMGLIFHIGSAHQKRRYRCNNCGKSFAYYQYFIVHHKKTNQGLPDYSVEEQQQMGVTEDVSMKKTQIETETRKLSICLNKIKEPIQIPKLPKRLEEPKIFKKKKIEYGKTCSSCTVCKKKFSRKDTANKHFNISHRLMRWKCDLCGFMSHDTGFFHHKKHVHHGKATFKLVFLDKEENKEYFCDKDSSNAQYMV